MQAGARPPLTRDVILRAAIDFADREGIESLSMRKLAQSLGYEVMSLYNHIANKGDLLTAMADAVAAEVGDPRGDAGWKVAMRETALETHDVLLRHPWACDQWLRRRRGPARLRHSEAMLRCLREDGFSVLMAHHAYHAITIYVLGFTAVELGFPLAGDELVEAASEFLRGDALNEFPYTAEHLQLHVDHPSTDGDFEFMLDLILDGLERVR